MAFNCSRKNALKLEELFQCSQICNGESHPINAIQDFDFRSFFPVKTKAIMRKFSVMFHIYISQWLAFSFPLRSLLFFISFINWLELPVDIDSRKSASIFERMNFVMTLVLGCKDYVVFNL